MRSPALLLRASFAKLRSERFCWPLSIEAKSTTLLLTTDFVAASGVLPNVLLSGARLYARLLELKVRRRRVHKITRRVKCNEPRSSQQGNAIAWRRFHRSPM